MIYFQPNEFHGWYARLDPDLKTILDDFRECWGKSVIVSPASGSVGRYLGKDAKSFHNFDRYGCVKAVDLMPSGMITKEDFKRAYECAVKANALGIGIYPDWKPSPGIHIDNGSRPGRSPGTPAKWSAFKINGKQQYFSIDKAF